MLDGLIFCDQRESLVFTDFPRGGVGITELPICFGKQEMNIGVTGVVLGGRKKFTFGFLGIAQCEITFPQKEVWTGRGGVGSAGDQ